MIALFCVLPAPDVRIRAELPGWFPYNWPGKRTFNFQIYMYIVPAYK